MQNVQLSSARQRLLKSDSPYKAYLVSKPEAEECFPFGDDVAVFKIRGKMFATFWLSFEGGPAMNLKCDPDQALALRDIFDAVIPGYHMNKKHWNTIKLNGTVPDFEIERMVDHSYDLVVQSLPKADRVALRVKFEKRST